MSDSTKKFIAGRGNKAEALDNASTTEDNNNKNMEDGSLKKTEDSFSSSSSSNAKRPGLASENACKKLKPAPVEIRFMDLSESVHNLIISFFDLNELLLTVQWICKRMQRVCNDDSRWLPVIAPPTLSNKVLNVKEDGKELRRLYKQYCRWMGWWRDTEDQIDDDDKQLLKLRSKVSNLDGYFSLSPWENSKTTYPTPWLHRMVYNRRCPTEDVSLASTPPFHPRPRMVLRRRTTGSRDPPSLFFQQRRRKQSRDHRVFYTEPIPPPGDNQYKFEKIRRVVIQPVNFLNDRLPDHDNESLQRCINVCTGVLESYFGPHTTRIGPVLEHKVKTGNCREDIQDLRDVDGRPVLQIHKNAVLDCPVVPGNINGGDTTSFEETSVVFLIAPHMYAGTFAWFYSSPLSDVDESVYPTANPWVVSTFQARQHSTENELSSVVAHLVLSSVLKSFRTMGVCENLHCVLNNYDSIEEAKTTFCFVPCCACIRKLQLAGVIGKGSEDVPRFLSRLRSVLHREELAPYSRQDLALLDALGYK